MLGTVVCNTVRCALWLECRVCVWGEQEGMIKGRGGRQKPGYEVPQLPLIEPLKLGLYSESKGESLKDSEVCSATVRFLTAVWKVD